MTSIRPITPFRSFVRLLRGPRFPAVLLLAAAGTGILLANTPGAPVAFAVQDTQLGVAGTPFALSVGSWIADGLLAVFFFTVAVELQVELTAGELRSARRAVLPALAAAGGVAVPIVVYLALAAPAGLGAGWPVPTATDIAFALGVLAVFGRGMPSGVRIFLLALAILDDIVGIVFIAVLFAHDVELLPLAAAVVLVVVFAALSRTLGGRRTRLIAATMVVLAVAVWALVLVSGVHATIAGVMLGLAIGQHPGMRTRYALEPWVNGAVLPLFALSAALVTIPRVGAGGLSPVFWAILVALPAGNLVGIAGIGWIAQRVLRVPAAVRLAFPDLVAAGVLGGIGFTVSLLLADLAFAAQPMLADQAVLGVLAGSTVSLVAAGIVVSWRARAHRASAQEEEA
jgi:NhaA family Na+:H+ antiporter